MSRILSKEYQDARQAVALALDARVQQTDRIYNLADSIFGRKIAFTSTPELNTGTVSVLLLLLTKALKTYRAIRAAALEGCGQDAAVLLRVLFETCTAVKWLLQTDTNKRAKMLAAYGNVRDRIMRREQAETPGLEAVGVAHLPSLETMHADWATELGDDTMKRLKGHWSGLSLKQVADSIPGWATAYTSVYRSATRAAHGADLNDHAYFPTDKPFPVFKLLPGTDDGDRVLTVAGIFLHTIASHLNEWLSLGMESDLASVELDRINRSAENAQPKGGA